MKKEDLIVKWLDNNLDESELKAFKELDASSAFLKIDQAAQYFKAPKFEVDRSYEELKRQRTTASKSFPWKRFAGGIAAALIISLGVYFSFFNISETTYLAQNAQKTEFLLPDSSEVILNADSQISFDVNSWQEARTLSLDGEAYFRVEKGSKYTVETKQGKVSVLGTQFDVKARDNFFEVVCYEGLVEVEHKGKSIQLPAGSSFMAYENKVKQSQTALAAPTWLQNKSSFISVPYFEVVEELERQYDINIQFDDPENNSLFTGSFTHENLETALQAITIPLNLSYSINGNTVMLKSK